MAVAATLTQIPTRGSSADPHDSARLDDVNSEALRDAVTVGGILAHERVFQRIANQNGGTRASGTPGYDASAQYVAQRLQAAGYRVREQEFTFPFFRDLAEPQLSQVSPTPTDYETGDVRLLRQRRRDRHRWCRPTTSRSRRPTSPASTLRAARPATSTAASPRRARRSR